MGFLNDELGVLKKEFLLGWKEEMEEEAVYELIEKVCSARVSSYTLERCFMIIEQTSVPVEKVDFGLAVLREPESWTDYFQQLAGYLLASELPDVPEIAEKIDIAERIARA